MRGTPRSSSRVNSPFLITKLRNGTSLLVVGVETVAGLRGAVAGSAEEAWVGAEGGEAAEGVVPVSFCSRPPGAAEPKLEALTPSGRWAPGSSLRPRWTTG